MSPSFDDPGYANANVIGQSWSCQQACGSRMAVHMSPSFNHPGRVYANELGQSWSCKQAGRAYANKLGPSWSCLRQRNSCTKTLCQLIFNSSDSVNIGKLQKRTHLLYDHENEMLLTLSKTLTNLESSS